MNRKTVQSKRSFKTRTLKTWKPPSPSNIKQIPSPHLWQPKISENPFGSELKSALKNSNYWSELCPLELKSLLKYPQVLSFIIRSQLSQPLIHFSSKITTLKMLSSPNASPTHSPSSGHTDPHY